MAFDDVLSILLNLNNPVDSAMINASQQSMAQVQDSLGPFMLGTVESKSTPKRTRLEIYSKWERMARFAPIAEALSLHVSSALGGDPSTGQQVFITPSPRLREQKLSKVNQDQLERLEKRIKPMERLLNQHIFKICLDGITFGDAYARVYGKKSKGVTDLVANEFTYPPLIQSFERLNQTVAYHALDPKNWRRTLAKLNSVQMARLKMPRLKHVPQYDITDAFYIAQALQADDIELIPIIPGQVGGSFLTEVEEFFDNVILCLSSMTSQQVADAVKQEFLSINMSAMSPSQRKAYINGLQGMLADYEKFIKNALNGGDAIYTTKFHVLPSSNDKQVLTAVGDLKGQRNSVNTEVLMLNVRLMMGGLGMDPSMVGWADMLTGGIGDGAFISQSAQTMRRSLHIRASSMMIINHILALDWGYAYNEYFEDPLDYPWQIEFYSDQSAAMSEALSNQQSRLNLAMLRTQLIAQIKELNLSIPVITRILERDAGMDYDEAMQMAQDLKNQAQETEGTQDNDVDDEDEI